MKIVIISLLAISLHLTNSQITSGIVSDFVRTNLIGYPLIHEPKTWIFDPDVALKRRKQFVDLHGDKGEKLIERLGLGIDGNYEERLAEQRKRDEGHLGGLNAHLP
ncbi:uncharacterized protein LOC115452508 [Manduca sexta]|uniref:Uncharacterized protein n=1 Tax=Manduca sexta TaxID=7130 RepID=A0A921ZTZ9_MANSE|nr:uncharacterized protein LOC115452508 [Manduca sexta]KAG6463659.1 hypothetical protein O3G_MSEX013997 [Manduca sexta]KAG6463660.1 hypothetical protein O3G_MSEX013997 [Manduca sexta]